jgi:hypothetical protein
MKLCSASVLFPCIASRQIFGIPNELQCSTRLSRAQIAAPQSSTTLRRLQEPNFEMERRHGQEAMSITPKYRTLFRIGAFFNLMVSIAVFFPKIFYPHVGITPIPEPSAYVHLSSGTIGMFGLFYYWASEDFPKNSELVLMGIIGKIGVNILGLVHVFVLKTISWHLFKVTAIDLIFAVLFSRALMDLNKVQKQKKEKWLIDNSVEVTLETWDLLGNQWIHLANRQTKQHKTFLLPISFGWRTEILGLAAKPKAFIVDWNP